MAALFASLLCALIILKPQEIWPALDAVAPIDLLFGLTVLFAAVDVGRGSLRPALAPQIPIFLAFVGWALLVTLIKHPEAFLEELRKLAILASVFFAVAIGASSAGGLKLFAATFLGAALIAASVALAQYASPLQCFLGADEDWAARGEFVPDGRPCETVRDCREDEPVPGGNYICERRGPLNTFTIGGRVRYRGSLADPNDLSLLLAAAVPFGLMFAEAQRKQQKGAASLRLLPTAALLGLIGFTVAAARSRTGLLAFLLVTGIYFVRRVGAWGVVAGCIVTPPMLLYGGRSGSEADDSTKERTELLLEAFELLRRTKGLGIGAGQFTDESSISMNAHNAYMLAAAEAGVVGVALFGLCIYASLKVPLALWFGDYRLGPWTSRLAPALAVSIAGTAFGIVFLSWTFKDVFYMLLAASAALYAAAKAEDPRVSVRLSAKELTLVPLAMMALVVAIYAGARLRR